jgi:chemotaxis-related protein WspB
MLFLTFQLGQDRYAIEASHVVEVLPLVCAKEIPQSPPGIAGLIDYHGMSVPLIDLAELALGKPSRKWMSTRIILVNYAAQVGPARILGVVAEQVTETLRRSETDFQPSALAIPGAPFLGSVLADAAGMIQRVAIEDLLPEGIRNLLFPELAGAV